VVLYDAAWLNIIVKDNNSDRTSASASGAEKFTWLRMHSDMELKGSKVGWNGSANKCVREDGSNICDITVRMGYGCFFPDG